MNPGQSSSSNNIRRRRRAHGRENRDWQKLKEERFLLLLSEKQTMTKEDALRFLQENPPRLEKPDSERILQRLTHDKDLEFDGHCYSFTARGARKIAVLKRISGYIDSFILDAEKAPRRASEVGVVSNCFLGFLAIFIGILSHSLALSTEGVDAGLDVLTSIAIWAGIRGGRERVSALFGSLVMTSSGAFLAYRSFNNLFMPGEIGLVLPAMIAAIIVMAVDYVMMVYKHFVGKRSGTLSLVADAYHNKTDVIAAVGVLVGIFGSSIGFLILDPAVGILVSAIIMVNGLQLIRECVHSLSGSAVNWSKYGMWYERTAKVGRSSAAERLILETLKDGELAEGQILGLLQNYDPVRFLHEAAEKAEDVSVMPGTLPLMIFSPEVVAEALSKLEKEGAIEQKDGKYSLTVR